MTDSYDSPSILPNRTRSWYVLRVCLTYAGPLLVLSWARPVGVDEVVVMLAAIVIGLTHGFWPPLTTSMCLLGLGQFISLANAEKLRDTGDAILWQDIRYAVPNFSVNLGTVWQYVGISGLLACTLGVSLLLLIRMIEKRYVKRSLPIGIAFSSMVLVFYLPAITEYSMDVAKDIQQFRDSGKNFAGNLYLHSLARFLHTTTLDAAEFQVEEGNSALFAELSAELPTSASKRVTDSSPDILVILNESQFNPSRLAVCSNRNDCRMSLYDDHRFSKLRGPLKVHTHGWGTWNAEFTLMTGVPYFWFGENGFYSAYTTAPRIQMALARHLSSLGYRTIGIYPTQKGMLNGAAAYRHYGIQEFYGAEDLELPLDWCQVPDKLMYEKFLIKYKSARNEDNRPIFMIMLTVFNHGPHGKGCMDSQLKAALGENATSPRAKLEDYIHRSRGVDRAATAFRDTALESPRNILLLFAGDHQPSFEGLADKYQRRMHRKMSASDALFFTDYQFFANYKSSDFIPSEDRFRELDISFLASTLLELAMLPMGSLFQPNLHLRDLCKGRLDSCPSAIIDSYKAHLSQVGFYK